MKIRIITLAFILLAAMALHVDAQIAQEAYVKASNTGFLDRFGTCTAISGDTMVVTALSEDSAATGVNGDQGDTSPPESSGAAYVFVRDANGMWAQQAYLKASNTGPMDQFGTSCAIDGDTIVIGAQEEDSNATGVNGNQFNDNSRESGAAYVFVRNGTTWTQQAYLKASNTKPEPDGFQPDLFGNSVAVSGDTIVVGAPFEDGSSSGVNGDETNISVTGIRDSGAAYVFVRNGTTWSQQAYLKQSNNDFTFPPGTMLNGSFDRFGSSVAVDGDTIAVGAVDEDSATTGVINGGDTFNNDALESGAVYVFTRTGTTWSQQAYIKGDSTDSDDDFGSEVALDGNTLAVGVPFESSNATGIDGDPFNNSSDRAGAVYIYVRDSNSLWSRQAYIKASNTIFFTNANFGSDNFGIRIGLSDDRLVVGAPGDDSDAIGVNGDDMNDSRLNAGAAFVFSRTGSTWSQEAFLKASNPDRFEFFGSNVSISGNTIVGASASEESNATGVNGDQTDDSLDSAGAVYVFRIETDGGVSTSPSGLNVFRGMSLAGGLAETTASDDSFATYNPSFTINDTEAPVWLIFDGVINGGTPSSSLELSLESNAGTPGLTITLEAFNSTSGSYDVVGTEPASFNNDVVTTVDLSSGIADYVTASGAVNARFGWRQTGFILNFPWEVRVDEVLWNSN